MVRDAARWLEKQPMADGQPSSDPTRHGAGSPSRGAVVESCRDLPFVSKSV
jgi:hypothetical protein